MAFEEPTTILDEPAKALEDCIALIAVQAASQCVILNRVKLVKLLYFLDLRAWKERGRAVTGVEWRWDTYGPYAEAIVEACERVADDGELETTETTPDYGSPENPMTFRAPRYCRRPNHSLITLAAAIVGEYGTYTASALSDLSYKAEPMRKVQEQGSRGDPLEFPSPAPSRNAAGRAIARYARLAREMRGEDEGDVAAALREDMDALGPARAAAT